MQFLLRIFLTLNLIPLICFSQKQANIWYFGENSGLDFTSGTAMPISNSQIQIPVSSEGCASICDNNGNLLFYATAKKIRDRNYSIMPNGDSLMGGISSTQGVIIIPKPGSNKLFYVFTLDQFQNNLANGLNYSIVDMCLNDGFGDVITGSKNIHLLNGTGEKMAATFHNNGNDIWLVTRKHYTNEFYCYLITAGGIQLPVISPIGWDNPLHDHENSIGQMKISPNGKKLAFGAGNMSTPVVQLFDFDNSTGIVSNVIDLPTSIGSGSIYGIAFSPDNSKLYVRSPQPTGLDQFDLSSNNPLTIQNSLQHISSSFGHAGTGLQLGNDGKIYVSIVPYIGVIYNPNELGDLCNFVETAISSNSNYTLPSFIDNFQYKNETPECTIVPITEEEEDTLIIPNVFSPNGDFINDYFPGNPGKYSFDLKIYNRWGTNIYAEQGNIKGWEGKSKNGSQNSNGTYYYTIKVQYPSGDSKDFHGFVLLIREK